MAEQFSTNIKSLSKGAQEVLAANAKSQGMTAEEYLVSRGGVNPVTNMYGDSFDPNKSLSDAEYRAAIAGKTGLERGKAINAATSAKMQAYIAANPNSPEAIAFANETRMLNSLSGFG